MMNVAQAYCKADARERERAGLKSSDSHDDHDEIC